MTSGESHEDATLVRVLSIIDGLEKDSTKPTLETLRSRIKLHLGNTLLDYLIQILLDKDFIERIASYDSNLLDEFRVNAEGRSFLKQYREDAARFVTAAKEKAQDGARDKLYDLISNNRNLFWFAYYEGILTRTDLDKFIALLDMEMKHFFFGKGEFFGAASFNKGYGYH